MTSLPKGFIALTDKDNDVVLIKIDEIHALEVLHDRDCKTLIRAKRTFWVREEQETIAARMLRDG